MSSQIAKKQAIVQEVKEKLDRAASIVLVDARGLTVEQDTVLRKKMREEGIDYKVYKNSIIDFAVKDTPFADIAPHLNGPTTLAISYDDATAAARVISEQQKAAPVLEFKAGVIESTLYDAAGVAAIANIPSRDVLIAKLLGSFKSPLASFARVINAIAENGGAVAVEEAPAVEAEAPVVEAQAAEEAPVAEAPVVEEASAGEAPSVEAEAVVEESPVAEETPEAPAEEEAATEE